MNHPLPHLPPLVRPHDDRDVPCILNEMKAQRRRTWKRRHRKHKGIAVKDV